MVSAARGASIVSSADPRGGKAVPPSDPRAPIRVLADAGGPWPRVAEAVVRLAAGGTGTHPPLPPAGQTDPAPAVDAMAALWRDPPDVLLHEKGRAGGAFSEWAVLDSNQ